MTRLPLFDFVRVRMAFGVEGKKHVEKNLRLRRLRKKAQLFLHRVKREIGGEGAGATKKVLT